MNPEALIQNDATVLGLLAILTRWSFLYGPERTCLFQALLPLRAGTVDVLFPAVAVKHF